MDGGTLRIQAIHLRALRVQVIPSCVPPGRPPEIVLVSPQEVRLEQTETEDAWCLSTDYVKAYIDKQSGRCSFLDSKNRPLTQELPENRKLIASNVREHSCFLAQLAFHSPGDELLHGLGQFQDGHFNVRGISRRLVQVNTQIALPFLMSDRGYGLLWNQYGLTEFNPCDTLVHLSPSEAGGEEFSITVTGSTGSFTESGRMSIYHGEFECPADGEYVLAVDYHQMTNLHHVELNGARVLYQKNFWLPPYASVRVKLSQGRHQVMVKSSKEVPTLAWRRLDDSTTFRSPHAHQIDYVLFAGSSDEVIQALHSVSGSVPLLPQWAYGFWQCRERYTTQAELLENAQEFRERRLPLDVMVQDWQYWPHDQWAGMVFDSDRFPNPPAMLEDLNAMNLRLIISVWENVSRNSDLGRFYESSGYFLPDSPWLDMTNPKAAAAHWDAIKARFLDIGIAGWWLDATEPENDALAGRDTYLGAGEFNRLTYPFYTAQAVAQGQLASAPEKRVCILSRSAFLGQQRFGTIAWSGDVGWDWDALRRQIVSGLNFSICGQPFWTVDIGGFFRPDDQYTSTEYREVLVRWLQFGTFLPIFRIHGFGSKTELWRYGPEFEEIARAFLDLRYQLLPYIYSCGWQITKNSRMLLRPLMMDFPDDPASGRSPYQFLFGPAFMVAPVTEAAPASTRVVLPGQETWFDFWTNEAAAGGTILENCVPLTQVPLFVRGGSIIPIGPRLQHSGEELSDPIELRIYPGRDTSFTLYKDSGDGDGYQMGQFSEIEMRWSEAKRELQITQHGAFPGMSEGRTFSVRMLDDPEVRKQVEFSGAPLSVQF